MNQQELKYLSAALFQILLACEPRVVDMNDSESNPLSNPDYVVNRRAMEGTASDVLIAVNETVHGLKSDGTRVYWSGSDDSTLPISSGLHGCQIDACADSFVTYSTFPPSMQSMGIATYDEYLVVGESLYWIDSCEAGGVCERESGKVLASCPVTGCEHSPMRRPRIVLNRAEDTSNYAADHKVYFAGPSPAQPILTCEAESCNSVETFYGCVDGCKVQGHSLTITGDFAYWHSGDRIERLSLAANRQRLTLGPFPSRVGAYVATGTDVYWTSSDSPSVIYRCGGSSCESDLGTPVIANLKAPNWLGVIGDSLFWAAMLTPEALEIRRCHQADCQNTAEVVATQVKTPSVFSNMLFFTTTQGATTFIHRRVY